MFSSISNLKLYMYIKYEEHTTFMFFDDFSVRCLRKPSPGSSLFLHWQSE